MENFFHQNDQNCPLQYLTKILKHVGGDIEGEITNQMVIARTKTEERQLFLEAKSPKKQIPVRYPFKFVENIPSRKSLQGSFQSKVQTTIGGTENTIRAGTEKIIHRKFI